MKNMILSLLTLMSLTLSWSTAHSQVENFDILPSDYLVEYISWCDDNKVVSANQAGQFYLIANCEAQGQTCKTIQRQTTSGTYYYGACMAKK